MSANRRLLWAAACCGLLMACGPDARDRAGSSGAGTDAAVGADAGAVGDTATDTVANADTEAAADTATDTEAAADAATETDTEAAADTATDTVANADTEAAADAEAASDTDTTPPPCSLNACGGCSASVGVPGTPCGPCNLDTWSCSGTDLVCSGATPCPAPPVVPPNPPAGTSFADGASFLWTGPDAPQQGATALQPEAVGLVRGRVLAADNTPLGGVQVDALGAPDLGTVKTQADGTFVMALNGPKTWTLRFAGGGVLPVQRHIFVDKAGFAALGDVVLTALDAQATAVTLGPVAPAQTAVGSEVTDADGTRTARVVFKAGTSASMVLPDGSSQPLTDATFRATEFTVGPNGPDAMPAPLPPTTHYTYCVELSFDEAIAAGATSVTFDKAVPFYVDDFLGMPVGTTVPVGWYDRAAGAWKPGPNGLVMELVGVDGAGLAQLDITGNGSPATSSALSGLGIDAEERQAIADQFTVGERFWRTAVEHFTPYDCNWGVVPPNDAEYPGGKPPTGDRNSGDPCYDEGSIIACENQALGERIPVPGTDGALYYWSDRVAGRTAAYTTTFEVTGANPPASLLGVYGRLTIAGQTLEQTWSAAAGQTGSFVWDGLDGLGREVGRRTGGTLYLGYRYEPIPVEASGGSAWNTGDPNQSISGVGGRDVLELGVEQSVTLGLLTAHPLGPAGWSWQHHHDLDMATGELSLGDGRRVVLPGGIISRIAGNNAPGSPFDHVGQDASTIEMHPDHDGVMRASDGSVYFGYANDVPRAVYRVTTAGVLELVAGGGSGEGEGVLATTIALSNPRGLAEAADGSILIADYTRLRRVDPAGLITTIGGNGATTGKITDGVPATDSRLNPFDVTVGPDGQVYAIGKKRIRRIDGDGIIHTYAGGGGGTGWTVTGASVNATETTFGNLQGADMNAAGQMVVADDLYKRVGLIDTDGVIRVIAGDGTNNPGQPGDPATSYGMVPTDVAWGPAGEVYVADGIHDHIVMVTTTGQAYPVLGGPESGSETVAPGLSGPQVDPTNIFRIDCDDDGNVLFGHQYDLWQMGAPRGVAYGGELLVPSPDGAEVFYFTVDGQHTKTSAALTGQTLRTFGYDAAGRLATQTDEHGAVTTFERDADGTLTAIKADDGRTTTVAVAADGTVSSVQTPGGQGYTFGWQAGALLTSLQDPAGGNHAFDWSADGRLTKDTDPDGRVVNLSLAEVDGGYTVTQTTGGGRTTVYTLETLSSGAQVRSRAEPWGGTSTTTLSADGLSETLQHPNGTTVTVKRAPDPIWGLALAYAGQVVTTMPSGAGETTTVTKTATEASDGDPVRPATLTTTIDQAGATTTVTFDRAAGTWTRTSPAGAIATWTADADGRVVSASFDASTLPMTWAYDGDGRLQTVGTSGALTTLGYDAAGRLQTITPPLTNAMSLSWDNDDLLSQLVDATAKPHNQTWTGGLLQSISRPAGGAFAWSWTDGAREQGWTLPDGASSWAFTRGTDGELTGTTGPSGAAVTWTSTPTSAGPTAIGTADATVTLTTKAGTELFESVVWTPTSGSAQTLSWTWDGALLSALEHTGAAAGRFDYTYDGALHISSVALTNTSSGATDTQAWTIDGDGAPTSFAGFAVVRGGPARAASEIGDGTGAFTYGYDSQGQLVTKTLVVGGSTVFSLGITRDAEGRTTARDVTVGAGPTETTTYGYDTSGRLLSVGDGNTTTEQYGYDDNNNLDLVEAGVDITSGTFDAADRLTSWGGTAVTTDADGFVVARGADTFDYSVRGRLLSATVGGQTVSYSYDGFGRRTARTDATGTTQYLYGDPRRMPLVTHSVDPTGVLTAWHYDDAGVLVAFDRGGVRYYVATDEIGTPLAVFDSAGVLTKTLTWSPWGVLTAQTGPALGFDIGFAGGLRDAVTGLLHFWMRDYDPQAGRWMALDPARHAGGSPNLYVYAGNDPVNRVDPTGMACVEVSYYAGLGGGVQVCFELDGMSICAEAGVGLGGGADFDALGGKARAGYYFGAEVMVQDGPVGAGYGYEIDDCGRSKHGPKCQLAIIKCQGQDGFDDGELGTALGPEVATPEVAFPKLGVKAQGKAYYKQCAESLW